MSEVQAHGFTFERWVRTTFFGGYEGKYGQEWDVPADKNTSVRVPAEWRGLPLSVKSAKSGSSIGLGDVLRQRRISAPFLMIVGFWSQRTATHKWIEDIGVAYFSPAAWTTLWGSLTLTDLSAIDTVVKNMSLTPAEARLRARAWKADTPAVRTAKFVINPKIDSKCQRRIQCSLPADEFWKVAGARTPAGTDAQLFGEKFPNPIASAARRFNG